MDWIAPRAGGPALLCSKILASACGSAVPALTCATACAAPNSANASDSCGNLVLKLGCRLRPLLGSSLALGIAIALGAEPGPEAGFSLMRTGFGAFLTVISGRF